MDKVAAKIESEIKNRGAISFARFMELALYCPVYGYYEKEGDIIGPRGDYYTSVSVGSLFGQLLACQFSRWCDEDGEFALNRRPGSSDSSEPFLQIFEAGAHRGDLARDVLQWFQDWRPDLFQRLEYWLVEPSRNRRGWQQRTLARFSRQTRWITRLSTLAAGAPGVCVAPPFRIVFANELLDALPVHRFGWNAANHTWFEWGVTRRDHRFVWIRMPVGQQPVYTCSRERHPTRNSVQALQSLRRQLAEVPSLLGERETGFPGVSPLANSPAVERLLEALPDGFIIEISTAAERWWRRAATAVGPGKLIAIDYGRRFEELLTPERGRGTLRAYRRHQVTDEILGAPGQQDLTADVNFSAIEAAGESAGLKTELYLSQSSFLIDIAGKIWGGQQRFAPWSSEFTRQFQTLTHPEHLGRAFRVLVQSHGRNRKF
ncbi:MAG TPA: SAM-dependent methyltransferase [Verrucomicrobiae bacterium]